MESQRLLPSKDPEASEESLEDDWTDRSSYNSYSESDSNSTIPDWEPYVDDFSGELFYIDCHPFVTHSKDHNKSNIRTEPFSKSQLRRSTRGKFLRLLRRRESKRYSKKGQKPVEEGSELNTQKVKFQDFQEGEEKVVTLEVDSENRYNLSGDKSLAESLLGLIVSTLSDGSRVMIAGLYLTMIGTVYNVATQVLFLTLMTYIASQLTALKLYGKYFHLYYHRNITDLSKYEENDGMGFFRSFCIKHQDIIRFVDDVNFAMRNVLFMEYFLNSLNIAAVMIRILMMSMKAAYSYVTMIFAVASKA